MKVLHVFNELKYSGAEIMYRDASGGFMKNGLRLWALSTGPCLGVFAEKMEEVGFNTKNYCYRGIIDIFGFFKFLYWLLKLLRDESFDVIHVHRSDMFLLIGIVAYLKGIRCVYTFHNVFKCKKHTYPIHFLRRWLAKNVFSVRFQSISDSVYENEVSFFKNKTALVYNWYSNTRFYPQTSEDEKVSIRTSINLDKEDFVMITVGGCSDIKRHEEVIHAVAELKDEYSIKYLHLGDGCNRHKEEDLVRDLGLEKNVIFLGNVDNVRQFLVASDLYVMPSRFEGIPITTIEAMGTRIPCLLYDVPGLRDFNSDGENALIIPPNRNDLINSLRSILSGKIELGSYAENGKCFVDKKFDLVKNSTQILELYKEKR